MQIAIVGSEVQYASWSSASAADAELFSIQTPEEAPAGSLLIDLLFDGTSLRIAQLSAHQGPVWVNDVAGGAIGLPFVRFNGWNGFDRSATLEAAAPVAMQASANEAASALGKTMEWLPNEAGFVSPRVIALIVNEAFHTYSEGVSTKEAIDTAMKLGTNYPHGPFEWARIIGLKNIADLLQQLSKKNARYEPDALLLQESIL